MYRLQSKKRLLFNLSFDGVLKTPSFIYGKIYPPPSKLC